jgi:benzylsuccinate CoA-transferase BbsF subunit
VGMLEAAFIAGSYTGDNPSRLGSRLLQPWGIFPCLDGLVFLVCVEQDQWSRLVEFMGRPEWTEMGLFDTNELRGDNEDLLSLYISEWTAQHTVDELWREGQARRICFAPVQTMADMQGQPHLEERGFVVEVEHPVAGSIAHLGAPFVDSERRWGPLRPAPVLDPEARPRFGPVRAAPSSPGRSRPGPSGDSRPLEGVRVLDLSWVWAGPYCGMHLGFLGAEVIKIESAQRPGLGRRLAIYPPDVEPSLNASAYFNQWDQGKLSCELDLSEPSSIRIIEQLVADSDVVLENFATGVMDRLGLSYERLSAINPEIIVASISGYGSTGPLASFMGYGPTTGPLSGLTSLTGYAGGQPRELGIAVGDPTAGITAGFAIAASLVSRRATGRGAYVDVSLWEGTASNAIEGWMAHVLTGTQPDRMGNRDESMAPHNCYRALGDDEWVSIACADETQWRALAEVIGSGLGDDARFVDRAGRKQHEDELDALITQWTRTHDRWLITEALQAVGVPAFASMSPLDLLVDPHLEARGFLERLDHPEVGRQVHTGVPWRSRTSPHGVTMPAPLLGQHTEYVLSLVKP